MLSPYLAYFLGFLTIILLIVIFYLIARASQPVQNTYETIFCSFPSSSSSTTPSS